MRTSPLQRRRMMQMLGRRLSAIQRHFNRDPRARAKALQRLRLLERPLRFGLRGSATPWCAGRLRIEERRISKLERAVGIGTEG